MLITIALLVVMAIGFGEYVRHVASRPINVSRDEPMEATAAASTSA